MSISKIFCWYLLFFREYKMNTENNFIPIIYKLKSNDMQYRLKTFFSCTYNCIFRLQIKSFKDKDGK